MSDVVDTVNYKGYKIQVIPDQNAEDPRSYGGIGTMVTAHRRYTLGDEQIRESDFGSWEEVRQHLIKDKKAVIIMPLYLYDHSGLRMKVGSFQGLLPQGHAEFDSGMVGFIYTTKDKIKKDMGVDKVTDEVLEKAKALLEGEVETYDSYLSGDVYGYRIVKEVEGEELDACEGLKNCIDSVWGFFGDTKYLIEDAKGQVDSIVEEHKEVRAKQREEFKQAWRDYPEEWTEPHKKVAEVDYWEE